MPTQQVNGVELHYQFDGPEDGPVLMFSNSLMSNLGMWDPQIDALTGAGFRVLRYDSRGHGRSGAPQGPYGIEMLADDAVGLMDALGLDKVHFCGLSKGGMVGQMLGVRFGGRLLSLTLCDTAAYMGPASIWEDRISAASQNGMEAMVDATIDRWFTKPGQTRMPEWIARIRRMIAATPVPGFVGCCMAIRDMDQRDTIAAIATPTLVIVGEEDPGTPVSAAELIRDRIDGAKLVVLPDAAHLSNIEQADAFNAALLAFLKLDAI